MNRETILMSIFMVIMWVAVFSLNEANHKLRTELEFAIDLAGCWRLGAVAAKKEADSLRRVAKANEIWWAYASIKALRYSKHPDLCLLIYHRYIKWAATYYPDSMLWASPESIRAADSLCEKCKIYNK